MKINKNKIIAITLGQLILATAITFFYTPHYLLSGGVNGISILLQYMTGYSSGIFNFVLNIPLLIFGYKNLPKDFIYSTIYSTTLYSIFLIIFKRLNINFMVDDIFLSTIFGGVISGLGIGLLFKYGASGGGLDILAMYFKQEYNVSIGNFLMIVNIFVVGIGSIFLGLERGMYTLVAMAISYQTLDKVVVGTEIRKQVTIISDHYEEIASKILEGLKRGVTLFHAKGAYSADYKEVIYCIATNRELVTIERIVDEIDPKAFIAVSDINEVKGNFRR